MRRGLLLIATWALGASAATVLALGAVGAVGRNVTDRRVQPLSPRAVARALEDVSPADTATTVTTPPTGGPDNGPPTTTATGRATTTTRAGGGPGPSATATTARSGSASTTTTRRGTSTPSTSTSTTTTTRPPDTSPARPFDMAGGTEAVRCNGDSIAHAWASPKEGYTFFLDRDGPQEVKVHFSSGSHTSKFEAFCKDGQPQVRIEEK